VDVVQVKFASGIFVSFATGFLAEVCRLQADLPFFLSLLALLVLRVLPAVNLANVAQLVRLCLHLFLLISALTALLDRGSLTILLFLASLRLDGSVDAQLATFEFHASLFLQGLLHLLLVREHYVANAFTEVCLRIPNKSDVLNGSTSGELGPQILFTNDEGQVANENRPSEVFPGVHASVPTTA